MPLETRIAVFGTSNAITKGAFPRVLANEVKFKVDNWSIGGCPNVSALYCFERARQNEYDVIIFEHAVTDIEWIEAGKYTYAHVETYFRIFIRQAKSRWPQAKFIAVLIPRLEDVYDDTNASLFKLYQRLLSEYNVLYIDLKDYIKAQVLVAPMAIHLMYQDHLHISRWLSALVASWLGKFLILGDISEPEFNENFEDMPSYSFERLLNRSASIQKRTISRENSLWRESFHRLEKSDILECSLTQDNLLVALIVNRYMSSGTIKIESPSGTVLKDMRIHYPCEDRLGVVCIPILTVSRGNHFKISLAAPDLASEHPVEGGYGLAEITADECAIEIAGALFLADLTSFEAIHIDNNWQHRSMRTDLNVIELLGSRGSPRLGLPSVQPYSSTEFRPLEIGSVAPSMTVQTFSAPATVESLVLSQDVSKHCEMAWVFLNLGKTEEAHIQTRLAERLDPAAEEVRSLQCEVAIRMSEDASRSNCLPVAEEYLYVAIRADPLNPRPWHLLGQLFKSRDQVPNAIEAAKRALSLQPGNPHLHGALAGILAEANFFGQAETHFRTASKIDPSYQAFSVGLVEVIGKQGAQRLRQEIYDTVGQLIRGDEDEFFRERLVGLLILKGEYYAARAEALIFVSERPTTLRAIELAQKVEDICLCSAQALTWTQKAIVLAPTREDLQRRHIEKLLQLGELSAAKQRSEEIVCLFPSSILIPGLLSRCNVLIAQAKVLETHHRSLITEAALKDPRVLFLGDSITSGWSSDGAAAWIENFAHLPSTNIGVAGDTTSELIRRIERCRLLGLKPSVIVILIGTNDLTIHSEIRIADNLASMIFKCTLFCPDSRILMVGILPRGFEPGTFLRQKIERVNRILATLKSGDQLFYLDAGQSLLGPDGSMSQSVSQDGIHLSAEGYKLLARPIKEAVEKLLLVTNTR